MREVWVDIPEYVGIYQISNFGNVRSLDRSTTRTENGKSIQQPLKGQLLKASKSTPYLTVNLCKDGNSIRTNVHEVVARLFIGPRPRGEQVCHRDGDGYNPRLDNLRYGTPKSNSKDRRLHGTDAIGENNPGAKLTTELVVEIKKLIDVYESDSKIASMFHVSTLTIKAIRLGQRWSHVTIPVAV